MKWLGKKSLELSRTRYATRHNFFARGRHTDFCAPYQRALESKYESLIKERRMMSRGFANRAHAQGASPQRHRHPTITPTSHALSARAGLSNESTNRDLKRSSTP